jgi:pimeloyl-ACP methyl ester carboxylesterase
MKTLGTLALTLLAACAASPDVTAPAAPDRPRGQYAAVNGVDMYYEIHGTGRPLVLIHGAFCTIDACFGKALPALAAERQVIAVELQGHGRTRDIDRPLDAGALAGDVVALLDQLGIDKADVFGYSLGAAVALELALERPERVGKLVIQGFGFDRDGFHPGLFEGIEQITPEAFAGSPWETAYRATAPEQAGWPVLIEKVKAFNRDFAGWTADQLRSIKTPTLVMVGDSDIVTPEHAAAMFRLLGGGVAGDVVGLPEDQLAVLPGTTHVTIIERGAWVADMVNGFLGE